MKTVFRADASLQIGSGHVMRCLTLADALRNTGNRSYFLCSPHAGNLIEYVRERGYTVCVLPKGVGNFEAPEAPSHASWLGMSQQHDAAACIPFLQEIMPDWLVVDHYALDTLWERKLRPSTRRLMVIDDLADRPHDCDLLLDQNLGKRGDVYNDLVPARCTRLIGPEYALLRPEFAEMRSYSLSRRQPPNLNNILITMGGVDQNNATSKILNLIDECKFSQQISVHIVMGSMSPWIENVKRLAKTAKNQTKVFVSTDQMAKLMADSDLMICASGGTSWERCCLAVPALMVAVADNQIEIARSLEKNGAGVFLGIPDEEEFNGRFLKAMAAFSGPENCLADLSSASAKITAGLGTTKVLRCLES